MPNTRMMQKGAKLPDPVGGYDTVCYQIEIPNTIQYVAAFKGQIAKLGWWQFWEKTGDTKGAQAAQIWRDALATLRECEGTMFELRTKPTDICVIQQSTDGGENWIDVFDFGACLDAHAFAIQQSPTNSCVLEASYDGGLNWSTAFDYSLCDQDPGTPGTTIYNIIYNYITDITILYNNNTTTYAGNIINIWVDGVYDASPDDDDRDAAQCLAYHELVKSICLLAIEIKENEDNDFDNIMRNIAGWFSAGSSITGVLVGLGVTLVSPWMAIGLAIGALASTLAATMTNADITIFEDETARENVACCMYNALKGSAPTFVEFQASLSGCGFVGGSNSEQLRAIIEAFLTDEDLYLQLFQNIQNFTELALLGLSLPCPCTPVISCTLFDENWFELGATPADWSGERYVSHGGAYIADWTRADNTDWTWVNEWEEGRVTHYIPGGCTPTQIGMGYERLVDNSYYFNIRTWDGIQWTNRAGQSGGPGGAWAGAKYFTWDNTDAITIYGVQFQAWTRRYKIYRSRITST